MVPPWLAENPRIGPGLAFGREQQFVVDPDGIPELCDMLAECPRHRPTPLYALPALAARLGLDEIRVKDESQRFGFGAFKALGGVLAVYSVLSSAGTSHCSSTDSGGMYCRTVSSICPAIMLRIVSEMSSVSSSSLRCW